MRSFEAEKTATDYGGVSVFPLVGPFYQLLEIGDGAVDEDAFCVVAGGVFREESIGASGEDEDIIRESLAG